MVNDFLMTAGAAVRVNDAGRQRAIRAFGCAATMSRRPFHRVMRNEDYSASRILADGTPVRWSHRRQSRLPAGTMS